MYEYNEESNPLDTTLLPHLEIQLDNLPVISPFVPRICEHRGYFFLWKGDPIIDSDLIIGWLNSEKEEQWLKSDNIIKGVALVYPYSDHVIIGSVKLAGYMRSRSASSNRKYLKSMWNDIITMFGHKQIVCPSGSLFEKLHLSMNNKKIPHEAYHWKMMQQNGFKRNGDYWVRP